MKAIVYEKYGSPEVLQLSEVETPTPKEAEVLIKIYATSVTKFDCWMRSSTAPLGFGLMSRFASGIRKPKQMILGTDFAGEIEAVGKDVTRLKVGDQVYGFSGFALGTHAEYICLPEEAMTLKPVSSTYEEATVDFFFRPRLLFGFCFSSTKSSFTNSSSVVLSSSSIGSSSSILISLRTSSSV